MQDAKAQIPDWQRIGLAHSYELLTEAALVLDVDERKDLHSAIWNLASKFPVRAGTEGWEIGPTCARAHDRVLMESEGTEDAGEDRIEVWRCPDCGRAEEWG